MIRPGVDELVSSLLYEGYALYPYTPGAAKNATPTPFGIVYPPEYTSSQPAAFSLLRLECVLRGGPEARVTGSVRFLQAAGERHKGTERRLDPGSAPLAELAREPVGGEFEFPPEDADGMPPLSGRVRMRAELLGPELARVRLCVHNDSELGPFEGAEPTRAEALHRSLLSVHPMLEVEGGSFVSPLERDGPEGEAAAASEAVNTFPVLVGDGDAAVLGATIMLPEHPELAPESLGNLFDNTEIEEALLLHVQALSDEEREGISQQDPAVREMIERADSVSDDEMLGLHGRLTYVEPKAGPGDAEGERTNGTQLVPPAGIDVTPGEHELELGPRRVRLGDKVVLRPGTEGDVYDKMLHGRTATVERIYKGYDERVYLGVTVDDDPGQELLRETGRYLFFFADEVELPA
ncbi:MAG: hypothetical protein ABWZ03_01995 [Solirubrobacterales bacterium]